MVRAADEIAVEMPTFPLKFFIPYLIQFFRPLLSSIYLFGVKGGEGFSLQE